MRKSKIIWISYFMMFFLLGNFIIPETVLAGAVESEMQLIYEGEQQTPLEIIEDTIVKTPTNAGNAIKKALEGKLPQTNEILSLTSMFLGLLLIVVFFVVWSKRRRRTETHD